MLNPESRELFGDALRPPQDFELDQAIATTYSLDLTAMLLAPLSFARLDGYEPAPSPGQAPAEKVDPFALLKSLRGHAERITVFCQAGQIHVPSHYQRLYAYLENSVVPVVPASKLGVFHPKMWALRFVHPDGALRYRLLCLSRNLTFDSSWDTVLTLDGELNQDRTRAHAKNHPLANFFAALPSLAVNPVSDTIKRRVERISDELRRVEFELPPGFDELEFNPIGIPGHTRSPFPDGRPSSRLVVSPFVSDKTLADLPGARGTLVSRLDELDRLKPETLALFDKVMVLADGADQPEQQAESEVAPSEWRPPPVGLHAKLFVFDEGWNSTVWSGSANATTAAFSQNVEFLVSMSGKKSRVGTEPILEAMQPLLVEFRGKGRVDATLTVQEHLEAVMREARCLLARTQWTARAERVDGERFSLSLETRVLPPLPTNVSLKVFPATLQDLTAQPLTGALTFSPCSFEALTPFFVFEAVARSGDEELVERFVVSAQLVGAPENRLARVLDDLLSDPVKVLRFLQLLLADTPSEVLGALEQAASETVAPNVSTGSGSAESPLLESMLRALATQPGKLASIARLVDDLAKTQGGSTRLPRSFLEAWKPIHEARTELNGSQE